MKLYEITGQFSALDSMDLETSEDIQAYGDLYAGLEGTLKEKIEASCKVIKNSDAEIEALSNEMARLSARKKTIENRTAWLKGYMQENLEAMGLDKVDTYLFSVRIQANPPSVDVTIEAEKLPEEYQRVTIAPDKTAIKEALKAGIDIEGCTLSQSKSLRIK